MQILQNKFVKFVIQYIIHVGVLWAFLQAYPQFRDDTLTKLLESYWFLIYIIPLCTAWLVVWGLKPRLTDESLQENINTSGGYSPGKVAGSYKISNPEDAMAQSTTADEPEGTGNSESVPIKPTGKNITTHGDFSPGEVGGDYTIEL